LADYDDSRIRHIVNRHRTSFSEQLNLGLSLARADLVARMDADDVCEPERLARQWEFFQQHPDVDLVGSDLTVIDNDGQALGERHYPASHNEIIAALSRFSPLAHPSVMFRKEVVVAAGGYLTDMCSADYDLWNRLYLAGARFANLPEPLLRYRVHSAGMKTARLRQMLRGTLAVKEQYWRGKMTLSARLRMLAEQVLLWLPAALVLKLFLLVTLDRSRRSPSPPAPRS
jgi:glycosyltransferase involved in cell wall biosynthesis